MLKYLTNNASDGHWFLVMFMGWFLLSVYALHPLKLLILIMFSALDFISFSFCWWVRVSSTTNQLYPQNILLIFTLFRFLSVVYIKCEVWVFLFLFQRMRKMRLYSAALASRGGQKNFAKSLWTVGLQSDLLLSFYNVLEDLFFNRRY